MGTDIEQKLSDLIDDPDFQSIDRSRARFNIFESIGAVHEELRHSNFLAFLLSPSRSHGYYAQPLLRLLRAVLDKMPREQRPLRPLELVLGDLDGAVVYREWNNIDLLVEIKQVRLVVVIENKVHAKAGEGQLARYRQVIQSKYRKHRQLFVFLTPEGDEPDEPGYVALSYTELGKLIENLIKDSDDGSSSEAAVIMRHYVEMLRRHIVPDEALEDLARQLYERHKEAFDFIIECRPEPDSLLRIARSLIENTPGLTQDRPGGSILRFIPKEWNDVPSLNAGDREQWTRTGRNLIFEIRTWNKGPYTDRVVLSLISGPASPELRERLYSGASNSPEVFHGLSRPMGRLYATIFMRELLSPASARNMDIEQKTATISEGWASFLKDNLPKLIPGVLAIVNVNSMAPKAVNASTVS